MQYAYFGGLSVKEKGYFWQLKWGITLEASRAFPLGCFSLHIVVVKYLSLFTEHLYVIWNYRSTSHLIELKFNSIMNDWKPCLIAIDLFINPKRAKSVTSRMICDVVRDEIGSHLALFWGSIWWSGVGTLFPCFLRLFFV